MRFNFAFFFSLIFLLLSSTNVLASSNFATSYDATYIIGEEGTTHALFNIELTNKTTEYFASSYKIKLGLYSVMNVKASDSSGQLSPSVIRTDEGQTITVDFDKKVVGKGMTRKFFLSFDTTEIAEKQGSIWEINIPGLADQKDFDIFSVHVKIPKSFGSPSYIKPNISNESLDFTKENLGNGGISIAFGDVQYYSFFLTYHLENTGIFPKTEKFALPPSTNYQTVIIDSITPKPKSSEEDIDGNWITNYDISPSQKINVTVEGRVIVNLIPKQEKLTDEVRYEYTKQNQHWEKNAAIIKLANELQTPKNIYDYVVKHLNYDFSRVTGNSPRLGAIKALENPNSAVCLEFTDLFIALARAARIPAREIDGFAYTQNSMQRPLSLITDILHAWPEYYDDQKQMWIMVDPTWGNTTNGIDYFHILDFDHVAFVRKGAHSDNPIPAGGYKTKKFENERDIHVTFTEPFEIETTNNVFDDLPKEASPTTIAPSFMMFIMIGGILFVSIAFTVFIITTRTRHISFFR